MRQRGQHWAAMWQRGLDAGEDRRDIGAVPTQAPPATPRPLAVTGQRRRRSGVATVGSRPPPLQQGRNPETSDNGSSIPPSAPPAPPDPGFAGQAPGPGGGRTVVPRSTSDAHGFDGSNGMTRNALRSHDLVYAFGSTTAVNGLSFHVRPGEIYGLLGPNGAGKTTTIRMVCGILRPQSGTIRIHGERLSGRDAGALRQLRYVPQDLALFPTLTLKENLRFWCRMYGVPRRQRRTEISAALDAVGLTDRARQRTDRVSGGMKRRLNLAVALLRKHEAKLVVLDEPTVGVDTQSKTRLLETIADLRRSGIGVLYTSHDFTEIERLCDRVGIVDHGEMVVEGHPADLVRAHAGVTNLEDLFLTLTGRDLRD